MKKLIRKIFGDKKVDDFKTKRKSENLVKYGKAVLNEFSSAAFSHNVEYSLAFGTLLGSYREHGFIPHDDDIDIAVDIKYLTKSFIHELIKGGFELEHVYCTEKKDRMHLALSMHSIKFDIYSYKVENDKILLSSPTFEKYGIEESNHMGKTQVLQYTYPFKGYKKIDFIGLEMMTFVNDYEVLEMSYGNNFLTPLKKSQYSENMGLDNMCYFPMEDLWYNIVGVEAFINSIL